MLLLSFPIALLAAMQLPSVLGAMWDEEYAYEIPARLFGDGLIPVVLILASIIVASFTTCVKVVWPRGFKEYRHFLTFSNIFMLGAWGVSLSIRIFLDDSIGYLPCILKAAVLNFPWMYAFSVNCLVKWRHDNREAYSRHYGLITTAGMLAAIATSIDLEEFSGSFEDQYGTLTLCIAVLCMCRSLTPVLKYIWKASAAASDRIRSAGCKAWGLASEVRNKVWMYVLGVVRA